MNLFIEYKLLSIGIAGFVISHFCFRYTLVYTLNQSATR